MIWIGIDPGSRSGAIAIINDQNIPRIFAFDRFLWIETLKETLAQHKPNEIIAAVEKIHSMPKQGVSSTFAFGENYGYIQGVLDSLGIPFQLIPPKTWKKEFGLTEDKNEAIIVAKRLYPTVSFKRSEQSKKDDSNFAEALLMAVFAKRKL